MRSVLVAITMMVTCLSAMAQDVTHVDASTSREVQVRIAKLAAPGKSLITQNGIRLASPMMLLGAWSELRATWGYAQWVYDPTGKNKKLKLMLRQTFAGAWIPLPGAANDFTR